MCGRGGPAAVPGECPKGRRACAQPAASTAHAAAVAQARIREVSAAGRPLALGDPGGAVVPGRVPAREARDADVVARVRGVHEPVAADVDADVAEAVEEDQVAGAEVAAGNVRPGPILRRREV